MRKILLLSYLMVLSLTSCGESKNLEKGTITITVLNAEVSSLRNFNWKNPFYKTEAEKNKAMNFVKFKFSNKTEESQLFILDPYTPLLEELSVTISDKNDKIRLIDSPLYEISEADHKVLKFMECMLYAKELENKKYQLVGTSDIQTYKKYSEHSFILNPGEERVFTSVVYLPLVNDNPNNFDDIPVAYYRDIDEADQFRLTYKIDAKKYFNSLPKWEQQEMMERGINFYNDSIVSNGVKIKFID